MTPSALPTYSLADAQKKIELGYVQITWSALEGAAELEFDEEDIKECVCGLTTSDFDKTMPSHATPGTFQDVYKTEFYGKRVYTKLSLRPGNKPVVVSFKRDESFHGEAP
ncbi:MAG: type II toxin-antitoxin system MqsR family toxin [Gemmatimonadota bacterium]